MGEGVRGGVEASEAVYGIPAVIGEESIYSRSAGRQHCAQGLLRNYAETVTCSEMNGACRVSKKAASHSRSRGSARLAFAITS